MLWGAKCTSFLFRKTTSRVASTSTSLTIRRGIVRLKRTFAFDLKNFFQALINAENSAVSQHYRAFFVECRNHRQKVQKTSRLAHTERFC